MIVYENRTLMDEWGMAVDCSVAESAADDPKWEAPRQADADSEEPVPVKGLIVCQICGRIFKRSNHLTQHLRSHSGLCLLCNIVIIMKRSTVVFHHYMHI